MAAPGLFAKCMDILITASGIWIPATLIAALPWVQRQLLYLHKLSLWWFIEPNTPESFGFLKSQVIPFWIQTKDKNEVYTWLVAPVGIYARHLDEFRQEKARPVGDVRDTTAFRCLVGNTEARLVIYFHGNTATVAQDRRTQEYRNICSAAPEKIFVLSMDYRGFGYSKGEPSEAGLLVDAVAVIRWALDVAKIPPNRIVLHSQSLGTAVATAAAHYFANLEPRLEFAGLLLCAGFTDASAAFQGFGLNKGVAPLAPMRFFPPLQKWFLRHIKDAWKTSERLVELIAICDRVHVFLLHSQADGIMPWQHTENLWKEMLKNLEPHLADVDDRIQSIDLGESGHVESWSSGDKIVIKEILRHGDHNRIMIWSAVALALVRAFRLEGNGQGKGVNGPLSI